MQPKYQTLGMFLRSPFGRTDVVTKIEDYQRKYEEYVRSNRIRLVAVTEIEGAYYMHLEVPSESVKSNRYVYDVVIRFFTDDDHVSKENSLDNYYVQFFSNSPSFIYKYAVLYRRNNALIEFLYDKMNPEYADVLPEKSNATLEISFDKSIFYAARYMFDHKFRYMTKVGMILQKKKNSSAFFAGIRDFETVKIERQLIDEERKLQKEMEKYRKGKANTPGTSNRKFALQDTLRDRSTPGVTVVKASHTTAKRKKQASKVSKKAKQTARRTTYRPF